MGEEKSPIYTQTLLDALTQTLEQEQDQPPNQNCHAPPLKSREEIDCSEYPSAFTGVKREVKRDSLLAREEHHLP
jgi:hypothetical protein